jgi:pyruvate/2-oxoglutarate dehydrogenase complex dihydrolipoamide acyltransferase (E2) component
MPVSPRLDVERITTGYSQALRRMSVLTGFSPQEVLRAEAGSILKTWAGRTRIARTAQIELNERIRTIRRLGYTTARQRGDATVNAGLRGPFGRVWLRTHPTSSKFVLARGAKFAPVDTRFGPRFQANAARAESEVLAALSKNLPRARRAAGLARQSVVQIADALGLDLARIPGGGISASALAKARAAVASSGRAYRNGTGRTGGDAARAYVQLTDTLPYGRQIGMDRTLLLVLAGRSAYFRRNYTAGVFKSLQNTARAYPGLTVQAA